MTEFTKIQECLDYCNTNHLAFFRRDLNQNFAKIMVADSYKNIYDKIQKGENKYYESWGTNQCMKLYIDYEKKTLLEENETVNTGCGSNDLKKRFNKINEDEFAKISHKNDILNKFYKNTFTKYICSTYIKINTRCRKKKLSYYF